MLSLWESDTGLLESDNFARRVAIQDDLDRLFPDEPLYPDSSRNLIDRARALHLKLESANTELFASIRRQIQAGTCPSEFSSILHTFTIPPRGLAYDYLDDLISGVLQFQPPTEPLRPLHSESVFYQPTPARHIFHLISSAAITKADTLIDLGSGLGHVPLLASICTGASSIGIELDPAWIASAAKCANALNLRNVNFLAQDARQADLYLYTPFTGSTLQSVLNLLRTQASLSPIRIGTFGPCTLVLCEEIWLKPLTPPVADQISLFVSCR
jgi:hypothetical protein